jgi:hypothetical protein
MDNICTKYIAISQIKKNKEESAFHSSMKKESRSTICFDYARGKYSSSGFFFGLNEVF